MKRFVAALFLGAFAVSMIGCGETPAAKKTEPKKDEPKKEATK